MVLEAGDINASMVEVSFLIGEQLQAIPLHVCFIKNLSGDERSFLNHCF